MRVRRGMRDATTTEVIGLGEGGERGLVEMRERAARRTIAGDATRTPTRATSVAALVPAKRVVTTGGVIVAGGWSLCTTVGGKERVVRQNSKKKKTDKWKQQSLPAKEGV